MFEASRAAHIAGLACWAAAVVSASAPLGCERRATRHDRVDQPPPTPVAIGEVPGASQALPTKVMSDQKAAECGRGTGLNREGACVQLGLHDAGYVQRVQIPAGSFVMGYVPDRYDAAPARDQPALRWSGQPPRIVEVDGFWIDLHEVTRSAYGTCVEAGDCTPAACPDGADPAEGASARAEDHLPQTCVTWSQAEAFCRAHGGRLPSEAEWEYAARGSDARVYPWGNDVRDELLPGLSPAGRMPADTSYFGILGMGSNAIEWVADRYEAELALAPHLAGSFRAKDGPVARARAAHEIRVHCGESPEAGCRAPARAPERRVVKSTVSGGRRGVRVEMPPHATAVGLEGWDERPSQTKLGFRCAADLEPERDEPLTNPVDPPSVPLVRRGGDLEVFGGVAEAVSQREAESFCAVLRVGEGAELRADWRLPKLAELEQIADVFRGPGPVWTEEGGARQEAAASATDAASSWAQAEATAEEALAARCVRATSGTSGTVGAP